MLGPTPPPKDRPQVPPFCRARPTLGVPLSCPHCASADGSDPTCRSLARECAKLWVDRREELGYPMGTITAPVPLEAARPVLRDTAGAPRTLVVEIGSEELPPDEVDSALEQLRARVPTLLSKLRLEHGAVRVEGTPRRLAVLVESLAARQPDTEEKVRGPPSSSAFDAEGKPTKALEGFCKKSGVQVSDLIREPGPKGVEYCFAVVRSTGRPAAEVLADELGALVAGLNWRKSMRWNSEATYSRPLRWILAMHGDTVIPFHHAYVRASDGTRVLRNSQQPEQRVPSAEAYAGLLRSEGIMLSVQDRRDFIWQQARPLGPRLRSVGTVWCAEPAAENRRSRSWLPLWAAASRSRPAGTCCPRSPTWSRHPPWSWAGSTVTSSSCPTRSLSW